jgi:glycerol uptake facilitator protein
LLTGYETAMFDQNGNLYFWLPIVAPIIGGLIGGALWKFAVERYLPAGPAPVAIEEPTAVQQSEPKQQS